MYTHSLCPRGRVNWRIYHFKCVYTMSYVDADVCMRGCVHGHMHASMRMCVCVSVCMGTCMRVGLECVCGINSHTHTRTHPPARAHRPPLFLLYPLRREGPWTYQGKCVQPRKMCAAHKHNSHTGERPPRKTHIYTHTHMHVQKYVHRYAHSSL